MSDYKRGCDGEYSNAVSIIIPVDEVIRDRRITYEQSGDPYQLAYERKFKDELGRYGR